MEIQKKMMKKLMMIAAALAAAMMARADTEMVGGYTWEYRINGDTAEIYNSGSCAISPRPTGDVTIPSTLGGKTVTSIGDYALEGCSGLTSVTIPSSVRHIEFSVFHDCGGLRSIALPMWWCRRRSGRGPGS